MTFGSLFAGVGGFDLGLTRAGMTGRYAAEIDDKCNSVRRKHWPDEKQVTDVADVRGRRFRTSILAAGWPCQGNSVAGRRAGMADPRSGLWGEVVRILAEQRPRWFLGENVPGILSVNGGRDWYGVLRDLAELGYGFAYRILDAQWFGVPQRRRRVFVVGCLGDWRRAAEILFERESLPWDSPPRRETGARTAASLTRGSASGSGVNEPGRRREDDVNLVAHALTAGGFDASEDGTGRGTPLVPALARSDTTREGLRLGDSQDTLIPMAFDWQSGGDCRGLDVSELSPSLVKEKTPAVYQCHGSNVGPMGTLRRGNGNEGGGVPFVQASMGVRRLMPTECERLQGFPDDWTRYGHDGTEVSDSARYRMCGNAVAVPCIEWLGRRLMEATQ